MKFKYIKTNKKYGFTLVESLVAISILSISILGTYTAVQNSLQSSTIAKDQVIGFYLAQEGMEYIKNVRDENALHSISGIPTNWLTGLSGVGSDPCYFGKTCTIDSPAGTASTCSGGFGSCPDIKRNSSNGLYGYTTGGSWVATNFKRDIQFTQNSADEVTVTISIRWTNRGTTKSFQIKQILFNRQ